MQMIHNSSLAFKPLTNDQTVSLARIESLVALIDAWMVQNKPKLSRSKTDLLILNNYKCPTPTSPSDKEN